MISFLQYFSLFIYNIYYLISQLISYHCVFCVYVFVSNLHSKRMKKIIENDEHIKRIIWAKQIIIFPLLYNIFYNRYKKDKNNMKKFYFTKWPNNENRRDTKEYKLEYNLYNTFYKRKKIVYFSTILMCHYQNESIFHGQENICS